MAGIGSRESERNLVPLGSLLIEPGGQGGCGGLCVARKNRRELDGTLRSPFDVGRGEGSGSIPSFNEQ